MLSLGCFLEDEPGSAGALKVWRNGDFPEALAQNGLDRGLGKRNIQVHCPDFGQPLNNYLLFKG